MPEHFVLDTGPLIDFFVLTFEERTGERWLRRDWGIREESVCLSDMDPAILARHGPVDASLLKLVQAPGKGERRTLLTNEGALLGVCQQEKVPAHLAATWVEALLRARHERRS